MSRLLPALLPVLVVLAGCGGSGDATPDGPSPEQAREAGGGPSAFSPADPENPREAIARQELELLPEEAPPRKPGPDRAYTPWPGFGHDARHTGSAPVRGPQDGTVRWKRTLEGPVVPGPAISRDGIVYAASNGGVLHALDPKTGEDVWTFDGGGSYGSDLSTVPLVLRDQTILWPGPNQTLFAIGPDGKERSRLRFDAMPLSPALGKGGKVYVTDMAGGLKALSVRGGKLRERWSLSLGDGVSYASTTLAPDGTIYGAVDTDLVAVRDEGSRGRALWRFSAERIIETTPAVGPDGTIVVGTNDAFQYGVGPEGKERWRTPRNSFTYSAVAVTNAGIAYYGDHRGALNVVRAKDGEVLARHVGQARTKARGDVGIWTAPAIDEAGNSYFGTRVGHIYGFDAKGIRLFDIDTGSTVDSYPALGADGTLYIGSESGELYAIG
ncbi:MAG: PQQ-like beta-propeller repeat protein [Solirubrobacterales bacterium]|nr:PQQ-like beta-propeller repeat protein [Solirubrobacterales bacterium]